MKVRNMFLIGFAALMLIANLNDMVGLFDRSIGGSIHMLSVIGLIFVALLKAISGDFKKRDNEADN